MSARLHGLFSVVSVMPVFQYLVILIELGKIKIGSPLNGEDSICIA